MQTGGGWVFLQQTRVHTLAQVVRTQQQQLTCPTPLNAANEGLTPRYVHVCTAQCGEAGTWRCHWRPPREPPPPPPPPTHQKQLLQLSNTRGGVQAEGPRRVTRPNTNPNVLHWRSAKQSHTHATRVAGRCPAGAGKTWPIPTHTHPPLARCAHERKCPSQQIELEMVAAQRPGLTLGA
jgi:hypothetical protein